MPADPLRQRIERPPRPPQRGLLRITGGSALNLAYDEWQNFLGNRLMVDALLGRLRHRCTTVHIKGPSLREPQG